MHKFPVTKSDLMKATSAALWQTYVPSGQPSPPRVNNRAIYYSKVLNQLLLGSCSVFSSELWRMAMRFLGLDLPFEEIAEDSNYYEERLLNGTVSSDSGATMAETIQVWEQDGAMPEADNPYLPNYQTDYLKAPPSDWDASLKVNTEQVFYIAQANNVHDTKDALARGLPVLVAFLCFQELENQNIASTGWLPMPADSANVLGGHMVNAIGYDDDLQAFLILNQWGADWGIHNIPGVEGCFWMPYSYFSAYVQDVVVGMPDNGVQPKPQPTPAPFPKPPLDSFAVELGFDKPTVSPGTTVNLTANVLKNTQPWSTPNCTLQIALGSNIVIEQTVPVVNGIANLSQVLTQPGTYTGAVMVYDEYNDLLSQTATVTVTAPVAPAGPADVIGTQWQAVAEWAVNNHVMYDYGDGTFKPDQPITRGQMAASLMNLYNLSKH